MRTIFIVACALALAACAPKAATVTEPPAEGALPAPTPPTVTRHITAADNGKTITVAKGSRFAVELVGVPTAGYLWGVTEKPGFLSDPDTTGGDTTVAQSQPGFAGGNHWEVFIFTAAGAGQGKLRLEQRRPWEKDQPPAQAFEVVVKSEW